MVETVTKWICEEVIDRIISWVEVVLEYVYYVLEWVCWLVDWILFRWLDFLLCWFGFRPRRVLRVCVKILTDPAGSSAVSLSDANNMMADAAAIFARCDVRLVIVETTFLDLPEFMTTTSCGFGSMFSAFWLAFSERACHNHPVVTVFFVERMTNASGCAFPGTDWVIVPNPANGGDGTVVVQEIGHLADLWGHSDDPNNVMTDQPGGGTHDQITRVQCCMIRSSRFVSGVPVVGLVTTTAFDLTTRDFGMPPRSERGARR